MTGEPPKRAAWMTAQALGRELYASYAIAIAKRMAQGGNVDMRGLLPTWDQLGKAQRAAWAETAEYLLAAGERIGSDGRP